MSISSKGGITTEKKITVTPILASQVVFQELMRERKLQARAQTQLETPAQHQLIIQILAEEVYQQVNDFIGVKALVILLTIVLIKR